MALQNANSLSNKNDWKSLQQSLIALHQSSGKAYTLKTHSSAKSFLENYVTNENKPGVGAAQSILKFATGQEYFIPHLLPYVENGINKSINNPLTELKNTQFSVYPNPASQKVNFIYNSKEEGLVHITLVNTIGLLVYETDVKANSTLQIPLETALAGVYVLTANKGKEQVYQTKVICIK